MRSARIWFWSAQRGSSKTFKNRFLLTYKIENNLQIKEMRMSKPLSGAPQRGFWEQTCLFFWDIWYCNKICRLKALGTCFHTIIFFWHSEISTRIQNSTIFIIFTLSWCFYFLPADFHFKNILFMKHKNFGQKCNLKLDDFFVTFQIQWWGFIESAGSLQS